MRPPAGELKIWNFNSGAVLREYRHKEGRKEITAVAFLASGTTEGSVGEQEEEEGSWTGSAGSQSSISSGSEDEGPPSLVRGAAALHGPACWASAPPSHASSVC